MNEKELKTALYNAIIMWYDDSLVQHKSLEDETWIDYCCESIGITEEQYKELMLD